MLVCFCSHMVLFSVCLFFFFSSRRRHTRCYRDWSSDVCSSDLPYILLLWTAVRWLIAGLTSIAVIALIYHNAVPRTQPWHSVLPGATLATAVWFGATALFGWYLQRYADYSIIYSSLGVGIALLVWMYMISLIILVGAEFN